MSIETYYFKHRTCDANAAEVLTYLRRYETDLGYSVTWSSITLEDDITVTVSREICIYNSEGTVIDNDPLLRIRLGVDAYTSTAARDIDKYMAWLGYSGDEYGPSRTSESTSSISRLKDVIASSAYKTSKGLMIIFKVIDRPAYWYSFCIAKNTLGRLSAAVRGITSNPVTSGSGASYSDNNSEPFFIGDSKQGGVQNIIPMDTQDSTTGTNYSLFTLQRPITNTFSKRAGRTVLVPLMSKSDVYSPYIFLRFFSETPGSIGVMECDGVQYVTDGLFALKE